MAVKDGLEQCLGWLREVEDKTRMAEADEEHWNHATQDILHHLELEDTSYHEKARLAKTLAEVRKNRRMAKRYRETTAEIVEWISENESVIRALERVLGSMRKTEKTLVYRIYHNKTDILEQKQIKRQ